MQYAGLKRLTLEPAHVRRRDHAVGGMRVAAWSCCLSAAFRRAVVWVVQAGDTGVMQATDTAVGGGSRPGVPRQAIDIKRRTNGDQHMPRFLIERDLPG